MDVLIRRSTAARWSGGGQNLAENVIYAENKFPDSFSNSGRAVIARNLVPLGTFFKGDFVYMPQNAWAWHGPVSGFKERARRGILRLCSEFCMRRASKLIRIGPMIPDWNNSSDDFLPNVLDIPFEEALTSAENEEKPQWLPKGDFFLVPGSMWKYRNHDIVIRAFEQYRAKGGRIDIVFVGSGSYFPIQKEQLELRDKGIFLVNTRVSRSEVLTAMSLAKLCILPSHVEASPVTMLEAAAIGVPIVASDIAAHRYMAESSDIKNVNYVNTADELTAELDNDREFSLESQSSLSYRRERRDWWAAEYVYQAGNLEKRHEVLHEVKL